MVPQGAVRLSRSSVSEKDGKNSWSDGASDREDGLEDAGMAAEGEVKTARMRILRGDVSGQTQSWEELCGGRRDRRRLPQSGRGKKLWVGMMV